MSHSRRRKPRLEGINDPNLTPLIDVSLVLVVILLVATPMALQSGFAVSRAASSGRQGPEARVARIEISVIDEHRVAVNRVEVTREQMGPMLQPLLDASPNREVVVRCGDQVTHAAFVSVIDEAKARGAAKIAVVGG